MSRKVIDREALEPERCARLEALTTSPRLSWPPVLMWLLLTITFITSDVLAIAGISPLWFSMLLNSLIGYVAFSVVHDSIHRSISTNSNVNDWIGQLAVVLVAPYVSLKLFRWGHLRHHRFTSEAEDPDNVFKGPWWQLPFRWMWIDLFYLRYALRVNDKVSKPELSKSIKVGMVFIALLIALIAAGYGWEVLMLWFIPSRLIQIMLGFSFFWLPHVPHDTTQAENFTRATTIRQGNEWLLGPLLQYQNYHLIHHLFPSTPFYNNQKVFDLLEPELRQHELAIQHGFAIRPKIHPGNKPT